MSIMELKGLKGLQGLDTLLAESKSEELTSKESIFHLSLNSLQPGKYQPRTDLDESSLQELAASIQSQGIILPLIVRGLNDIRGLNDNSYEIIAGERRWRAARMAGLETVPAIIRNIPDETALAFALIENIQRESLNPIDEALAFSRLKDDFSMTHEEIAERVGRSRSAVTNLMRLLGLREEVKNLLRARKMEMGHARALISLDHDNQLIAADKIMRNGLSVREAEKLVQKILQPNSHIFCGNIKDERISVWENQLSNLLSSKAKISLGKNGDGKVVLYINSPDEIEWLIETIHKGSKIDQ